MIVVAVIVGATTLLLRRPAESVPCGAGFVREGARCLVKTGCPSPLVAHDYGCDTPERDMVDVPAVTVVLGASDWEAEGRVTPRTLKTEKFRIDRFEVTVGHVCRAFPAYQQRDMCKQSDLARAASEISLAEARAYCKSRGGRLPTDDEWLAAAAGDKPRRYPWGDTGAVCRRAAWGLATGPCTHDGRGPDTAGSHPDGVSPLGIHDLAGNVAEWVESPVGVRGGSWRSSLATELRTWSLTAAPQKADDTIGFRCAYDGIR